MRLFSFLVKGDESRKIGVGGDAEDTLIVDVSSKIPTMRRALGAVSGDSGATKEELAAAEEFKAIAAALSKGDAPEGALKQSDVQILAPVQPDDGEKVFCVGMNYKMHCEEQGFPIPTEPVIFSKVPSAISNPGDPIYKSPGTSELDFEVELAIVIGATCKHVRRDDAMKYVAGYTVAHDVSMRDWYLKKNSGQWGMGKAFDHSAPLGPSVVTVDTLGDPHKLQLSCVLNGETVQDSNTSDLIFDTGYVLEWITQFITLSPGDIILTGTPQGVGCFRKPPLWLKAGDEVTCKIEKIGSITNKVEDEKVPEGAPVLKHAASAAAGGAGGGAAAGGADE